MNEELIMKMVEPHLRDGAMTYAIFEDLFNMLSKKEQYKVVDLLILHNIELCDSFEITDIITDMEEPPLDDVISIFCDESEESDASITTSFKDDSQSSEYIFQYENIKQTNPILCQLIQKGNKQAENDLCVKNEQLVLKYANYYHKKYGNTLDIDDLLQAGFIGLLTAAKKFNSDKGNAFSTYAVFWIKQSISRELMDTGLLIRIPVHMMEKISKVSKLDEKYDAEGYDYHKRLELISEELHWPIESVEDCIIIKHQFIKYESLNSPVGEEKDTEMGDYIPQPEEVLPHSLVEMNLLSKKLNEVLQTLTAREAIVIKLRFGLEDGKVYTLEEIGAKFGVTRERIRQIQAKALRKLRHPSRSKKLKDFME